MRRGTLITASLAMTFTLGWIAALTLQSPLETPRTTPEVYFSPDGGARRAILEHIRRAKEEIAVTLYYFTDPGLADALVDARRRGISVSVLLDKSQRRGRYSQALRLREAGVAVLFDSRHRILHHKFMVVDRRTLITGSQNWTKSAETVNAENTLIIADHPALVGRFQEEFKRLTALAERDAGS